MNKGWKSHSKIQEIYKLGRQKKFWGKAYYPDKLNASKLWESEYIAYQCCSRQGNNKKTLLYLVQWNKEKETWTTYVSLQIILCFPKLPRRLFTKQFPEFWKLSPSAARINSLWREVSSRDSQEFTIAACWSQCMNSKACGLTGWIPDTSVKMKKAGDAE